MRTFKTSDGVEYEIRLDHVIKQLNPKPIKYNEDYLKTYDHKEYQLNSDRLSHIRLSYLLSFVPNAKTVLDVGYGRGDFLKLAASNGIKCFGYDVTNQPLPAPIGKLDEKNLIFNYYDVVTFFDSLEHFDNIDFVKDLQAQYVIISLPYCYKKDNDSWDFDGWKHRKPNEHLYHFSEESLSWFMWHQGYRIINSCAIEDIVRKPERNEQNILTCIFRKR